MQQRFLLQILLLAQHVSGTTMPIIRSSKVLYSGCCLWYFVLWFSSCWSGVELRVMCPVYRMRATSCKPDTTLSSTPDKQLENHSTKYHRQQPMYNTLELLASCEPDTQPSASHQTSNLKTTARNTTGSNHCIIL